MDREEEEREREGKELQEKMRRDRDEMNKKLLEDSED